MRTIIALSALIMMGSCNQEQKPTESAATKAMDMLNAKDSRYEAYLKDSADVEARIGLIKYSQDSTDVIKARTELPKERKDLEISRANYFNK